MDYTTDRPSLIELRALRDQRKLEDKEERKTIKGRNEQIARRYLVDGEGATALAKEYGITRARVYQIVDNL